MHKRCDVKLPNLSKMTFETLISLRDNVDRIISTRAADERKALEAQIAKLKGKRVAPKYRNPADKSQTWAGRGLAPRWMSEAIKAGKSKDDFLIKGAAASKAKGGAKKRGRKPGRPKKAA